MSRPLRTCLGTRRAPGVARLRWLAVWAALAPPAWGQEGVSAPIKSVEFRGLVRTNVAYVQDVVGVRRGDALNTGVLDQAVSRLLRTGKFLNASYEVAEEDDGVRVVFDIRERMFLAAVRFEGNAQFSDSDLAKVVGVKAGDAVDWFAIRGGREAIQAKYREAGFGDVVVEFDTQTVEQTGELVYRIEEGVRVLVRRIVYEGRTAFSQLQLEKQIATRTALWIFRTGEFDEDRAESDAAALQRFYRDNGYLDARVSYRKELSPDGKDLTLVFQIVEGTKYAVEEIRFEGNTALPDDELRQVLTSTVGETIRQPLIDQDVQKIQSMYWELGYVYSSVQGTRIFSEEPGLAIIIFQIQEGDQFRVGRVVVRGNARTRDKVVRRALDLYPPDDLFDLNEAKEAESRLLETRIFDGARVYPIGDDPERRDVVMDVQEAERGGDVVFGVGVTSNSGLVGTILLDLRNFDLADPPRTWEEFLKFRSFFGGGQRLRIELQPGTEVSRFRIDFTEPYLMDQPIRFDSSFYLFQRGRDGYEEQKGGIVVSLGKRFERGLLAGWSGELALRLEAIDIGDVDLFAAKDIREDEGGHFLASLKGTLVLDRTDNRFLPTEGDRFQISYEQFGAVGGITGFGKVTAGYTWYKTLVTDRFDRKSVLRLHGEGGAIVGDAPIFERFYAGGTGSMRGFAFRGIGPHEGIGKNNVGGDYLLLLGAEYSFPVYGENVRGHVFLDTGTAGGATYRAAAGVGVRIILDIFGPIPLEFNLAAPLMSDADDEEQVFSFLIGTLF